MNQVTRLANGLTVATATMPEMASVAVGVWVGVGARHEPASLNGVSHFIEHMLFKGTRRRSARAISETVEGHGGYLNAFTTEEETCFHARAGADRADPLVDVLLDMLLHSRFDPCEIEKERTVIKEELEMYRDDPRQHVQDLLTETLWPDHPLGRNLAGSEATVSALTRDQLLRYHRHHYVAGSTLLAAAGHLQHEPFVRMVARRARAFPQGPRPGYLPAISNQDRPRVRLECRPAEQTQLALGVRTCSRHDPRRHALRLLNAILGENMSSRLFQTLREEHGIAYSVHSGLNFFDDTGSLEIGAGLDAANLSRALTLILRELRRLTRQPPSVTEVRRARDYLIGQLELSLESTEHRMMWVGEQYLAYGRITRPDEVKRHVASITPAQITRVARDFFRPERLNLAVVSEIKSARGLARYLHL
ncbi:MAG TPA: pitrilysin family protein [Methylomirabilota bacterium]|nr:pitrilysin family protein [Methylomirabilota bacterium]